MLSSLLSSSSSLSPEVARRAIRRAIAGTSLEAEMLQEITFVLNTGYNNDYCEREGSLSAVRMTLSLLNWKGSKCTKYEWILDCVSCFLAK